MCGNNEHHEHAVIELPNSMITRRAALRLGGVGLGAALLAACGSKSLISSTSDVSTSMASATTAAEATTTSVASQVSALTVPDAFAAFADTVKVTREGKWWMVESDGMPAHNMMVGITSWQQQVPTSQPYVGSNAWSIPAEPVISKSPVSAKTSLYRGAIALAVNGVPIFNALNNRGDDAFLYGELDKWGGHAGRADDYHYHIAPLHLQKQAGANMPIAYALDGFPIYGESEPDGSKVAALDEFNGHYAEDGSYHYHGTRTYPYINGGLRGVITVSGDQIDPQPTTKPFREALQPLKGAVITSFETPATNSYRLGYTVDGAAAEVAYVVSASSVAFTFTDASGATRRETYARR
ncbi:MAG: YHYH protein [Actinomycetes bacterium]|jgi:hypothetical protein